MRRKEYVRALSAVLSICIVSSKIVRSGIINSKKLQDRLHRRRISGVN